MSLDLFLKGLQPLAVFFGLLVPQIRVTYSQGTPSLYLSFSSIEE
jgi:hypothetical protein